MAPFFSSSSAMPSSSASAMAAPVAAGTYAGQAVFRVNGQEVGRVDLLCGADVAPRLEPAMGLLKLTLPE